MWRCSSRSHTVLLERQKGPYGSTIRKVDMWQVGLGLSCQLEFEVRDHIGAGLAASKWRQLWMDAGISERACKCITVWWVVEACRQNGGQAVYFWPNSSLDLCKYISRFYRHHPVPIVPFLQSSVVPLSSFSVRDKKTPGLRLNDIFGSCIASSVSGR
jgi:hypothetical protein